MPVVGPLVRFGAKVGIVGGAVYYTSQIGLWGDCSKTEQLYKDIYKMSAPFFKQTTLEVPEVPRMSDVKRSLTQSWNYGVITSTEFLIHLPTHLADWASAAYSKVNDLVSDPQPPTA